MSLPSVIFVVSFVVGLFSLAFAAPPEKIVGGIHAEMDEFPYQASLQQNGRHFCGGSIIGKQYILTAAHCIQNYVKPPYYDITVVTGTNYLPRDGEIHYILKATIHPLYTPGLKFSWHNDIAVIKLTRPMTFNAKQRAIDLPNANVRAGDVGVVSGWGLQSKQLLFVSKSLRKIKTVISLSSTCQKDYPIYIYKEQFCTLQKVGISICEGDSGGPLVVHGKIVGIVSFSYPCGVGAPDVYTNVYKYLSFIKMQMT